MVFLLFEIFECFREFRGLIDSYVIKKLNDIDGRLDTNLRFVLKSWLIMIMSWGLEFSVKYIFFNCFHHLDRKMCSCVCVKQL